MSTARELAYAARVGYRLWPSAGGRLAIRAHPRRPPGWPDVGPDNLSSGSWQPSAPVQAAGGKSNGTQWYPMVRNGMHWYAIGRNRTQSMPPSQGTRSTYV